MSTSAVTLVASNAGIGPRQPEPVYDSVGGKRVAVYVGLAGQDLRGQAALYRDGAGNYYAHTTTTTKALGTAERGTAVARLREWIANDAIRGLYMPEDPREGAAKGQQVADRRGVATADPQRGQNHVEALKSVLAGHAAGGLSATDLDAAVKQARQVLGRTGALATEPAKRLQAFIDQGQRRLGQEKDRGSRLVQQLGAAIGDYDREPSTATRNRLNQALSRVNSASQSGWSDSSARQARDWVAQAGRRLWPKVSTPRSPGEQALARDGGRKALQTRPDAPQSKPPNEALPTMAHVGARAPNGHGLQGDLVFIGSSKRFALKGTTELYRMPHSVLTKSQAIEYAKERIESGEWSLLRPLDPRALGGARTAERGKQIATYFKPLRQAVDRASQEVSQYRQIWADLSRSKNNWQVLLDGLKSIVGEDRNGTKVYGDGDGFGAYDYCDSRLSSIYQAVQDGRLNPAEGQHRVKEQMSHFRSQQVERFAAFGKQAELSKAVAEGAINISNSSGAFIVYIKTLAGSGGNHALALKAATGFSAANRGTQDILTVGLNEFVNKVRPGGPDQDLKAQLPKLGDPKRLAEKATDVVGDAVGPWAILRTAQVVKPLVAPVATAFKPVLQPLANAVKPVVQPLAQRLGLPLQPLQQGIEQGLTSAVSMPVGSIAGLAPQVAGTKAQGLIEQQKLQQQIQQIISNKSPRTQDAHRLVQLKAQLRELQENNEKAISDQVKITAANLPGTVISGSMLGALPESVVAKPGGAAGQLALNPAALSAESFIGFFQGVNQGHNEGAVTGNPLTLEELLGKGFESAINLPITAEGLRMPNGQLNAGQATPATAGQQSAATTTTAPAATSPARPAPSSAKDSGAQAARHQTAQSEVPVRAETQKAVVGVPGDGLPPQTKNPPKVLLRSAPPGRPIRGAGNQTVGYVEKTQPSTSQDPAPIAAPPSSTNEPMPRGPNPINTLDAPLLNLLGRTGQLRNALGDSSFQLKAWRDAPVAVLRTTDDGAKHNVVGAVRGSLFIGPNGKKTGRLEVVAIDPSLRGTPAERAVIQEAEQALHDQGALAVYVGQGALPEQQRDGLNTLLVEGFGYKRMSDGTLRRPLGIEPLDRPTRPLKPTSSVGLPPKPSAVSDPALANQPESVRALIDEWNLNDRTQPFVITQSVIENGIEKIRTREVQTYYDVMRAEGWSLKGLGAKRLLPVSRSMVYQPVFPPHIPLSAATTPKFVAAPSSLSELRLAYPTDAELTRGIVMGKPRDWAHVNRPVAIKTVADALNSGQAYEQVEVTSFKEARDLERKGYTYLGLGYDRAQVVARSASSPSSTLDPASSGSVTKPLPKPAQATQPKLFMRISDGLEHSQEKNADLSEPPPSPSSIKRPASNELRILGGPTPAAAAAREAMLKASLDPAGRSIYREQGYATEEGAKDALNSMLVRYSSFNVGDGRNTTAQAMVYRQTRTVDGQRQMRYFPSVAVLGKTAKDGEPEYMLPSVMTFRQGLPKDVEMGASTLVDPTSVPYTSTGLSLSNASQSWKVAVDFRNVQHRAIELLTNLTSDRRLRVIKPIQVATPQGLITRTFEVQMKIAANAPLETLAKGGSEATRAVGKYVELEVKHISGEKLPFLPNESYSFGIYGIDPSGATSDKVSLLDRNPIVRQAEPEVTAAVIAAREAMLRASLDSTGTGIYRPDGYASEREAQVALSSVLARFVALNVGEGRFTEAAATVYRQTKLVDGQQQVRYFPSAAVLGNSADAGGQPSISNEIGVALAYGAKSPDARAMSLSHTHPYTSGSGDLGLVSTGPKAFGPSFDDILVAARDIESGKLVSRGQSVIQAVQVNTPQGIITRVFEMRASIKEGATSEQLMEAAKVDKLSKLVTLEVNQIVAGEVPFLAGEQYYFSVFGDVEGRDSSVRIKPIFMGAQDTSKPPSPLAQITQAAGDFVKQAGRDFYTLTGRYPPDVPEVANTSTAINPPSVQGLVPPRLQQEEQQRQQQANGPQDVPSQQQQQGKAAGRIDDSQMGEPRAERGAVSSPWSEHYEIIKDNLPANQLIEALLDSAKSGKPPGLAVDLGAGAGLQTAALAGAGWSVIAVDADPASRPYVDRSLSRTADRIRSRGGDPTALMGKVLNAQKPFAAFRFPRDNTTDLVYSGSLSFVPQAEAEQVIDRAHQSLKPGGTLVISLFGQDHGLKNRFGVTTWREAEVRALLKDFDIVSLSHNKQQTKFSDGTTGPQDLIEVTAVKRATTED
jgi:tellurite methyltransferase